MSVRRPATAPQCRRASSGAVLSGAPWGLRTAATGGELLLAWRYDDTVAEALLVAERRGGFLFAVPAGGAADAVLAASADGCFDVMILVVGCGPELEEGRHWCD